MRMDAYVTPTNNIDYNCHIKAIELILTIIWGLYHATSRHYLFIASGADTHTRKQTFVDKSNSKKPGAQPVRAWFKKALSICKIQHTLKTIWCNTVYCCIMIQKVDILIHPKCVSLHFQCVCVCNTYVCVYMYICMCVYYVCMCVCMYVRMCMYVYMCTYVCMGVCVCL